MKSAAVSDLRHHHSAAPKRVTILGVTGSIGQSTMKVLEHAGERFSISAMTAMDNVDALADATRRFRPALAVIGNPAHYPALKEKLAGTNIATACGEEGLAQAASLDSDIVVSAIVGAAGLKPTLSAIRRGVNVALANKECLVVAGSLMQAAAKRAGATLLPVDSEHSAIFQVLDAANPAQVEKVTITASGGPFRTWSADQMRDVTPAQAKKHPKWSMGAKISVDSATMMNKGLELIEAQHLFALVPEQLAVLVHPESIVHSLVSYIDGSVLAQLSLPDMCTPIAYALAWPERISAPVQKLDLAQTGALTFEAPDESRFPALRIAREVLAAGQGTAIVFNAANEIAVAAFLAEKIGFLDIARTVEQALAEMQTPRIETLDDVLALDAQARAYAQQKVG